MKPTCRLNRPGSAGSIGQEKRESPLLRQNRPPRRPADARAQPRRAAVPPTKFGAAAAPQAKAAPAPHLVPPPAPFGPARAQVQRTPAGRSPAAGKTGAPPPLARWQGPAVQRAAEVKRPAKPPGKTYASWEDYDAKKEKWLGKHQGQAAANFAAVPYLYHATRADLRATIERTGLQPRDPRWTGTYDASKDGFLSMATTEAGAGAMGGKQIMLRISTARVAALGLDFRTVSATEVRTTSAIPANELEIKGATGWGPLVLPVSAAAGAT
jgi:hypothetical protein